MELLLFVKIPPLIQPFVKLKNVAILKIIMDIKHAVVGMMANYMKFPLILNQFKEWGNNSLRYKHFAALLKSICIYITIFYEVKVDCCFRYSDKE